MENPPGDQFKRLKKWDNTKLSRVDQVVPANVDNLKQISRDLGTYDADQTTFYSS